MVYPGHLGYQHFTSSVAPPSIICLCGSWFSQDKKDKLFFTGEKIEEIDRHFLSFQPISEITRTPRSIVGKVNERIFTKCM